MEHMDFNGHTSPTDLPDPDFSALRDRALQFATATNPAGIEEFLANADIIFSYILNGDNPFVPSTSNQPL